MSMFSEVQKCLWQEGTDTKPSNVTEGDSARITRLFPVPTELDNVTTQLGTVVTVDPLNP